MKKLLTVLFLLAFYLCCIIILIVRISAWRVPASGADDLHINLETCECHRLGFVELQGVRGGKNEKE